MSREELIQEFKGKLYLHLSAEKYDKKTLTEDTAVSYATLQQTYKEVSQELENLCPITAVELYMSPSSNSVRYADLINLISEFIDTQEDYETLVTLRTQSEEFIIFKTFMEYVQARLNTLEDNVRSEVLSSSNIEKIEQDMLNSWKQYAMDYVKFLLNPSNRTTISVADILESRIMDYLRDLKLCDWMNYATWSVFRQIFTSLANPTPQGLFVGEESLRSDYALAAEQFNFTEAFLEHLWRWLKIVRLATDDGLNFRAFINVRRLLYHMNHVAGRRFLFDVLDFDQDGMIRRTEFNYFYESLKKSYACIFPEREFPSEAQAFISWCDQIRPDCDLNYDGLTFDDIKRHQYGADFLFCLTCPQGFDRVEFRFEDINSYSQDTEADTHEVNDELINDLLGEAHS